MQHEICLCVAYVYGRVKEELYLLKKYFRHIPIEVEEEENFREGI